MGKSWNHKRESVSYRRRLVGREVVVLVRIGRDVVELDEPG